MKRIVSIFTCAVLNVSALIANEADDKRDDTLAALRGLWVRNIKFTEGRIDTGLAELGRRINEALAENETELRVQFMISNANKTEPLALRVGRYPDIAIRKEGNALWLIDNIMLQSRWSYEIKGKNVIFYDHKRK